MLGPAKLVPGAIHESTPRNRTWGYKHQEEKRFAYQQLSKDWQGFCGQFNTALDFEAVSKVRWRVKTLTSGLQETDVAIQELNLAL